MLDSEGYEVRGRVNTREGDYYNWGDTHCMSTDTRCRRTGLRDVLAIIISMNRQPTKLEHNSDNTGTITLVISSIIGSLSRAQPAHLSL